MGETKFRDDSEKVRDQQVADDGVLDMELWTADDSDRPPEVGARQIVEVSVGTRGLEDVVNNRRVSNAYRTGHITMHRAFPQLLGPEQYWG